MDPAEPVRGLVSHIQPFSLHDGPGLRTTVFLMGCPLRCAWCHNPETRAVAPLLAFDPAACLGCGACAAACPAGAHACGAGGRRLDRARCAGATGCGGAGACAAACPGAALELAGERLTPAEVLARVLPDRPFFAASGGGLTVSGGEPAAQTAFTAELLRQAGAAGLHRTVETCAHAAPERVLALAGLVELALVDWKDSDDARHRAATGVGNGLIRANILALHAAGVRLRLRCPIIPGWNDRENHFAGIAALAAELPGMDGVEILPFHGLGAAKPARYGLPPSPCAGVAAPAPEAVAAWCARLRALGAPVLDRPPPPSGPAGSRR